MAILLKNGSVFLHIPKTGGRWVSGVLHELDLVDRVLPPRHLDIARFNHALEKELCDRHRFKFMRDKLRNSLAEPFMFCFVRSPFAWYESWFKFMSRPDQNWRYWGDANKMQDWHPVSALNGLGSSDFNEFIANVIDQQPGFVSRLFAFYTQGEVNYVGKQERLADDLIQVLKLLGMDVNVDQVKDYPMFGVSDPSSEELSWDSDLKRRIAKLEYATFVRHGYLGEIEGLV